MALTVLPLEVGGGRLDDDGEHEKKNIWKIKERKEQKKGSSENRQQRLARLPQAESNYLVDPSGTLTKRRFR